MTFEVSVWDNTRQWKHFLHIKSTTFLFMLLNRYENNTYFLVIVCRTEKSENLLKNIFVLGSFQWSINLKTPHKSGQWSVNRILESLSVELAIECLSNMYGTGETNPTASFWRIQTHKEIHQRKLRLCRSSSFYLNYIWFQ